MYIKLIGEGQKIYSEEIANAFFSKAGIILQFLNGTTKTVDYDSIIEISE